jgi:hypothetical protein
VYVGDAEKTPIKIDECENPAEIFALIEYMMRKIRFPGIARFNLITWKRFLFLRLTVEGLRASVSHFILLCNGSHNVFAFILVSGERFTLFVS